MRQVLPAPRLAALISVALGCVLSLGAGPAFRQGLSSGLRIVVIDGEDAVNVIQQKTAVVPVVEVRDRNDQPVAGALVNFAIRSGRATFGGARTLTVTTNTAGRAVAAGFAPTGTGALQISATAAFQGEAAAAVTIAQTNVMTAAQAAASSGATAGGAGGSSGSVPAGAGAGAGGGGLSATTIGIVGAAAAAGSLVAVRELGGGTTYRGQFSGNMPVNAGSLARPCVHNEQQTGTLEMTLDEGSASVTGSANIEAKISITPGTCVPDAYNTSNTDGFGLDKGQVTGSAESLVMTANASNNWRDSASGNNGVNSYDFAFAGRLEGAQITGTLSITRIVTCNNCGGPPTRGSVTHSVTLR